MNADSKAFFWGTFLLLWFGLHLPALAQKSRAELEQQKKENLKRIKEAERILAQTSSKKKNSLGELNAINHQLEARSELIESMNSEVKFLDQDIFELNSIITSMEQDLVDLKQEYAIMVYAAAKANNNFNRLTFIFSASSFNQFIMRLKYMQQYGQARQNQVEQIKIVKNSLATQKKELELTKAEKAGVLRQQVQEKDKLVALKQKQSSIIQELSKKENELMAELKQRQASLKKLDKLIDDVIKEELAKRKEAKAKNANLVEASAEELSLSFAQNKARLPWPVKQGFISSSFGKQAHPVLKGIMIDNDGIDIQTNSGETVKAVFNGKVYTVAFIPGLGNAVLIQHGEYFTVYAKLKDVLVKAGQVVKKDDPIGQVYTDQNGISELQFQIWKNSTKLNPQSWLGKTIK
jgi:murein hydrolase activator